MGIISLFVKHKNKTFIKNMQSDKSNNDLLMKLILDFFNEINLKFEDISNIFINQGPGNFSGLRGSIATAKGISLSKKLNLIGYNTFILLCAKFFRKKDFIYSFVKYREKYFMKKFNQNLDNDEKIKEVDMDEILKKYEDKFKIISKNSINHSDQKILRFNNLSITDLDYNSLEFLELKGLLSKKLIKPIYLS
tara:strand:- start:288 stop:866 length:579 start_codon:yes stop_codon:yes gene_type:complete